MRAVIIGWLWAVAMQFVVIGLTVGVDVGSISVLSFVPLMDLARVSQYGGIQGAEWFSLLSLAFAPFTIWASSVIIRRLDRRGGGIDLFEVGFLGGLIAFLFVVAVLFLP